MSLPLSTTTTTPFATARITGTHAVANASAARDEKDWSRSADHTAIRLGFATLGYVVAATLVITLAPFRFSAHEAHGLSTEWTWFDLVMNVVMFVPLGFLFRVTRPRGSRSAWWVAMALGALLSASIESAQLFEAARFSSFFDIATNTAGAAVGSMLFTLLSRQIRVGANTVSTLALELPLMGLVYLLVPLLWLVGLSSSGTERIWLMLPIAAFGGAILGAVHGGYLQPSQRTSIPALLFATAVWFIVASIPGGRHEPMIIAYGSIVAMAAAYLRSVSTSRARALHDGRRFELPTLRLVMPLFAGYLALGSLWPLTAASGTWRVGFELFPATEGELSMQLIFQALEFCAAFTVVGYLIAEFHGRSNSPYREVLARVVCWGGALAIMLELARGWLDNMGASAIMASLAMAACVFGGGLYHLQRDHVRALWARDRRRRTP